MECPEKTFAILEGRNSIGGTWDLFKYPGIRSDSDMHTFSYSFKPWTAHQSIADAATIMDYLQETMTEYELNEHIRFQHFIRQINWSSKESRWTVVGSDQLKNEQIQLSCDFLLICAGYYDYEEGYTPDFKGLEKYQGRFIHPQKWTTDIDYANKKVVVIGSGATAVTLVPAMAEKTGHITMLQRSPSYILSRPSYDKFAKLAYWILPAKQAHFLARWKNILGQIYLYFMSRKKPQAVKKYLLNEIRKVLGKDYEVDVHFNPKYDPWDERLCAVPDNDLFEVIKEGKCTMVTDQIDSFTETGIQLKSGRHLVADLVISATGLKLKALGGIKITVDGEKMDISKLLTYKGLMLEQLPNAAVIIGYSNASWTLKADLACAYFCRLMNYMDAHHFKSCVPRLSEENVQAEPIIDFSSGYIQRSLHELPKQGNKFPWKLHQNYIKDMIILKYKKVDDGYLIFRK
jgi:cation diffusion facilitator CzcD-associated flavoprotein CzcO